MLFGIVEGTLLSALGTTLGALILFFASRSAFASGSGAAPAWVERVRSGYRAYPVSYAMFMGFRIHRESAVRVVALDTAPR